MVMVAIVNEGDIQWLWHNKSCSSFILPNAPNGSM